MKSRLLIMVAVLYANAPCALLRAVARQEAPYGEA